MRASTAVLAVVALFAVGALGIAAAQRHPATRARAQRLWPVFFSEFLLVGGVVLPVWAGGWVLLGAVLLAAARGQYELLRLGGADPAWRLPLALATGAGVLLATALAGGAGLAYGLLAGGLLLWPLAGHRAAASLWFPVLPLGLVLLLRPTPEGLWWLLIAYAVVESNDAFALLLGRLFGRRHPFPRLSPGKTLEGLVLGLCCALGLGWLAGRHLLGLSPGEALGATAVLLAAGVAGDLALSALKRRHRAKDFPPLSRLHGGLLDIYDALLAALPVAWLLQAVLP